MATYESLDLKMIQKKAKDLYGKEVLGYKCKDSDIANKWQLVFADEEGIFIISESYIKFDWLPATINGGLPTECYGNYSESFEDLVAYYPGCNGAQSAIKYLTDKELWTNFVGNNALYAMGTITDTMLYESYFVKNGKEPKLSMGRKNVYVAADKGMTKKLWVAGISKNHSNSLVVVDGRGFMTYADNSASDIGMRPVVCIRPDIKLVKKMDKLYIDKNC